jgi:hypothetical protein
MRELNQEIGKTIPSLERPSMCPYKFAQRIANTLWINNFEREGNSPRSISAWKVRDFLKIWKTQSEWEVFTTQDLQLLTDELNSYQIPYAQYPRISERYPEGLEQAKGYATIELWSMKRFIMLHPHAPQNVYQNICLSFHEILAVLEIICLDLWISLTEAVVIAKKVLLNNATLHNSIWWGLLHQYLKFHHQWGRVFSLKDGKFQHTVEFINFTMIHLLDYLKDIQGIVEDVKDREELEYQLSLLDLESLHPSQENIQMDIEWKKHFLVNFFYDRIKFMCPFLRARGLEGFIDGVFQPFSNLGRL